MRWDQRYDSLFQWFGQKYLVPWRLLKAQAFAESGFDPNAKSGKGAMGLMQFTKIAQKDWFKQSQRDPYDPEEAIEAAADYMAKLHAWAKVLLHGIEDDEVLIWRFAASGYNAGWGYVRAALRNLQNAGKPIDWKTFSGALPAAVCGERRCDAEETLPYAEKVVPDASVLAP